LDLDLEFGVDDDDLEIDEVDDESKSDCEEGVLAGMGKDDEDDADAGLEMAPFKSLECVFEDEDEAEAETVFCDELDGGVDADASGSGFAEDNVAGEDDDCADDFGNGLVRLAKCEFGAGVVDDDDDDTCTVRLSANKSLVAKSSDFSSFSLSMSSLRDDFEEGVLEEDSAQISDVWIDCSLTDEDDDDDDESLEMDFVRGRLDGDLTCTSWRY
jgi:hypothetical protein